jgi:hypothetical protein
MAAGPSASFTRLMARAGGCRCGVDRVTRAALPGRCRRGDASPVAPNTTPEGRARNCRIDVTLIGPGN